ncbi:MAG: hypothetical protein EOR45_07015 [Mesorhizobium sp.]|nr:MAG: hypothetical protein EOR45_07015 [Mesorhizobium sp.]
MPFLLSGVAVRSLVTHRRDSAPLCPAGHLPHLGGDWQLHRLWRTTLRCGKIASLVGPDGLLAALWLGAASRRLYKGCLRDSPFREDRMPGFDIVMRGREA